MKRRFSITCPTAKDAIRAWHRQYGFASRKLMDGSDSGEISKRLRDLKRPTKEAVAAIIKHDNWTNVFCTTCMEYVPAAATFGDDYTSDVCEACLQAALKKLRQKSLIGR